MSNLLLVPKRSRRRAMPKRYVAEGIVRSGEEYGCVRCRVRSYKKGLVGFETNNDDYDVFRLDLRGQMATLNPVLNRTDWKATKSMLPLRSNNMLLASIGYIRLARLVERLRGRCVIVGSQSIGDYEWPLLCTV